MSSERRTSVAKHPSVYYRVDKHGRRRYEITYVVGGSRRWETIPGKLEDAQAALDAIRERTGTGQHCGKCGGLSQLVRQPDGSYLCPTCTKATARRSARSPRRGSSLGHGCGLVRGSVTRSRSASTSSRGSATSRSRASRR